jgi:hypothetical protein
MKPPQLAGCGPTNKNDSISSQRLDIAEKPRTTQGHLERLQSMRFSRCPLADPAPHIDLNLVQHGKLMAEIAHGCREPKVLQL